MSYKVISPVVAIAPSAKSDDLGDSNNGPRYFYEKSVIPDGFNDERCEQLADEGMLEKVKAEKPADSDTKSNKVEDVLAEVGDDKEKAAAALAAEQAKGDKARKTLVEPLESILGKA